MPASLGIENDESWRALYAEIYAIADEAQAAIGRGRIGECNRRLWRAIDDMRLRGAPAEHVSHVEKVSVAIHAFVARSVSAEARRAEARACQATLADLAKQWIDRLPLAMGRC